MDLECETQLVEMPETTSKDVLVPRNHQVSLSLPGSRNGIFNVDLLNSILFRGTACDLVLPFHVGSQFWIIAFDALKIPVMEIGEVLTT